MCKFIAISLAWLLAEFVYEVLRALCFAAAKEESREVDSEGHLRGSLRDPRRNHLCGVPGTARGGGREPCSVLVNHFLPRFKRHDLTWVVRLLQVDFLHEKGYLQVEHKETYIDEVGERPPRAAGSRSGKAIGWSIAVLGFLTQLALGRGPSASALCLGLQEALEAL